MSPSNSTMIYRLSLVIAQLDVEHEVCERVLGSSGITRLGIRFRRAGTVR